jgi:hypothetical protein
MVGGPQPWLSDPAPTVIAKNPLMFVFQRILCEVSNKVQGESYP